MISDFSFNLKHLAYIENSKLELGDYNKVQDKFMVMLIKNMFCYKPLNFSWVNIILIIKLLMYT